MSDVTRFLDRVQQGEPKAAEELLPLVYEELRKLAAHKMAQPPPGQTLQATSLVHEAWLKFFVGLSQREIGHLLGLSERTIERHWAYAQAWLFERMSQQPKP